MKIIYRANDGKEFDSKEACLAHEQVKSETEAERRAREEDFQFMVLCQAKGNMALYHLLRDRSLDKR